LKTAIEIELPHKPPNSNGKEGEKAARAGNNVA